MTWPTKKLGEIIEISYGKGLPKDNRIDSGKYFAYGSNGTVYSTDKSLTNGETIIIGRKGTAGALYFISDPCWPIDTTFFAKPKSDVSLKFVYYLLRTKRLPHLAIVTGVPGINRTTLSNIHVLLPPLEIQNQIVERLDKIAEAQKLNDGLIQKTDELFQSLLYKELNPAGKDWESKKLGDIIKPQYGYTTSAKDSGNYRFIRITDISDGGELRDFDKKYVILDRREAENYQLHNGDLLLARTGATFGKILYFEEDEPAIFASFLIRLSPNALIINPFYIWLFSRSQNYWQQAKSLMTGSGQPQFNANKLKQIKIPLPPLEIQKQIVAKLSAVQSYKKELMEQKIKLKELFDSMLHRSMNSGLPQ